MRTILMLNCEFPPIGGGAANMNWYFLKEAAKHQDLEIDLITSGVNHSIVNHDFGSNIRVWKVNIWKKHLHHWSFREMLTYLFRGYLLARKLVAQRHYDLIHAVFGFPSGLIAYLLRKKVPYVVSMRGSDVPGFNRRFSLGYKFVTPLIKRIWDSAAALTANSEGLKELALASKPEIDISVIPNGVDVDEFSPKVSEAGHGHKVLTVARLIERKGIRYLIEAHSKVKVHIPELSLTIVGTGDMQTELERFAASKNVSDSVVFLGEIPHNELPAIYSSHDLFVLPSFNEGMSNAVLEAMASGLPIISTSTGGTRELLDGNVVFIESGSSESIIDALTILVKDRNRRQIMGDLSVERAKTFSWKNTTREYIKLYDKVLSVN
ncbi:MAG: glycosyltransferase [Candidatus Marinimicrobia bacterium]|nr:glycosyltransferase [Candidatus Neomarinimicrobiota bacterium]